MNFFENKIAILISLLMQLKAYAPQKVNDMLEIEKLEGILDKPEKNRYPLSVIMTIYPISLNLCFCPYTNMIYPIVYCTPDRMSSGTPIPTSS